MKMFLQFFNGLKLFIVLAPVLMLVDTICCLIQPYYISKIIDIGIIEQDISYIIQCGIIMLVLISISIICAFGGRYYSSKVSSQFAKSLRKFLLEKIYSLSLVSIDKIGIPSIITRINSDVNIISLTIKNLLQVFARALFLFIGGIIMTAVLNIQLTPIIILLLVFIVLIIIIVIKHALPYFDAIQSKNDNINLILKENIFFNKMIKAFNMQSVENTRFQSANNDLKQISIKGNRVIEIINPLVGLLLNISIAVIIFLGAILINKNIMQIGELSAYIMYTGMLLTSLLLFSTIIINLSRTSVSIRRIFELLNEPLEVDNKSKVEIQRGKIEFKIIQLIVNDRVILKNIKFDIDSGEKVYVLGSMHSGKNLLIDILQKKYTAYEGNIFIDGIGINEYSLHNLRKDISIINQENNIFNGTIKENIMFYNPYATDEEICKVCEIAQIMDYINSADNGFDTMLLENGNNLSGGQKQRICIARGLLKQSKIIVFDNCFTSLDTLTEHRIMDAIYSENLLKNKTLILLAEKNSISAQHNDKIIILDNGEIKGIGTHIELLNNDLYKEMNYYKKEVVISENY